MLLLYFFISPTWVPLNSMNECRKSTAFDLHKLCRQCPARLSHVTKEPRRREKPFAAPGRSIPELPGRHCPLYLYIFYLTGVSPNSHLFSFFYQFFSEFRMRYADKVLSSLPSGLPLEINRAELCDHIIYRRSRSRHY